MDFLIKAPGAPRSVGVLAATFHPITRPHLKLAEAAAARVDEVLFVMPAVLPHKAYERVGLRERLELVRKAIAGREAFSLGVSSGGLFAEIAAEARRHYGPAELWFICGRDVAERIAGWPYPPGMEFERQLEEYGLLVAPRQGVYTPPPHLAGRILPLPIEPGWDDVSATEVRSLVQAGREWEHLVPPEVVEDVRRLYS